MGRRAITVFFALIVCCIGFQTYSLSQEVEQPPELDKGWSLISSPCEVALSDLKQKLGNDEILVFSWEESDYMSVDTLVPGVGYVLNDNAVLNSSMVCGGNSGGAAEIVISLGWNLIGNPYHESKTFNEVLGDLADELTGPFYELRGNKYVELQKTDHMKPFRGYWIFSGQDGGTVIIEPPTQSENDIAVTSAYYDDIGSILRNMGYSFDVIANDDLREFMTTDARLSVYKNVFINCATYFDYSYEYYDYDYTYMLPLNGNMALARFVEAGGELYISDFGHEFLEQVFPDKIQFRGKVGDSGRTEAKIVDEGLSAFMGGIDEINIVYDLGGWVPIESVSEDVRVYMSGAYAYWSEDDYGNYSSGDGPLMVSFRHGQGRVVYTTFHNEANLSSDVEKLLEYLALIPVTGDMATENEELLSRECDGCDMDGEYLNALADGEGTTAEFEPETGTDNVILVNSSGTLEVNVYKADGTLYKTIMVNGAVTNRSVSREVSDSGGEVAVIRIPAEEAVEGSWSYEIKSQDADGVRKPVVVTIGSNKDD
ncbi:hypothetical protein ACFLQK_01345 [bacterium]